MSPKRSICTAAILGAGLGTRVQGLTHAKPFLKVHGRSLLELQLQRFLDAGISKVIIALREELLSAEDKRALPQDPRLHYLLVNTTSSLHTLGEIVQASGTEAPLLATMVDTVLRQTDFESFLESLPQHSSALLCTRFIDDESPLYAQVDGDQRVTAVGSTPSPYVTAGMYWLAPQALAQVPLALAAGTHKIRHFLSQSIESGLAFHAHIVDKSIDLDRPEDLAQAEQFL